MFIKPMFRIVPDNTRIQFMRGRFLGLIVSAILSTASVVLFFYPGLHLGIDFAAFQAGIAEPAIKDQLRANTDELCRADELGDALRYPEGGPTAPSKAAAKIQVHPEFNLSLVASEPLINKVMNIDWDEKGRLWVCETPEYPNGRRKPNTPANSALPRWKDSGSHKPYVADRDPEDSISILTDTNGDGIMDTKKVFADKLELVTSFVLYKNGVIAATSPDMSLLAHSWAKSRTRFKRRLAIKK